MLPQIYRLTYQEFFRNRAPRQIYHSVNFDIFTKLSKKSGVHVVLTISKSIDKRSSHRNRTKRIIQESIRNHLKNFHVNVDIMIKSKKILKKMDRLQVEKELIILLNKAGITS